MNECAVCSKHPHLPDADCDRDCRSREADLGVICSTCAHTIDRDLLTVLETYALTNVPPWPSNGGDGRAKTRPLPGGTEWLDFRSCVEQLGVLSTWTRDVMDTYGLAGPKRGDLSSLVGWLRSHLPSMANSHPAISDFAYEVRALARRGLRVAEVDLDKRQRVTCPTDECSGTLRISVADLEAAAPCRQCGRDWTTAQLLNVATNSDEWVDEEVASLSTKTPGSTLRRWAKAGHIQRKNGLYRLASIREYRIGKETA